MEPPYYTKVKIFFYTNQKWMYTRKYTIKIQNYLIHYKDTKLKTILIYT